MRIYGVDFTSAPRRAKPITCAICVLEIDVLRTEGFAEFAGFEGFEELLVSRGPWVAAMDFPFGQPRKLVRNLGWPESWESYVGAVASMSKAEFELLITRYCDKRPPGDKHHRRGVDRFANARSPMMLVRVPVGKMFFEGASRLLRSGACVMPCRPNTQDRVVLEGYPALVARRWLGKRSYKNDAPSKQSRDQAQARRDLLAGLRSRDLLRYYGVTLDISDRLAKRLVRDPMADKLDALLCAIQAAWAYAHRDTGFGLTRGADRLEGWIADPM